MNIERALKLIDEANLIVERKSVKDMTPEEYEKDLEARRKRRELRKQRPANIPAANQPKNTSDEDLRRKNAEQIAKGYEDAEREIKSDLNEIRKNFEFFSRLYDGDKAKFARTAAKSLTNIKDKLESGNLLSDVRTSMDASKLLDEIQKKITEIKSFIRGNKKPRYMDEFRYLEVSFQEVTQTGNTYNAKPINNGRPMDEWGKSFRIYIWDLPERFDSRNVKVSKSEFIKWLKTIKLKRIKKFVAGTRRNNITWTTYDVEATTFEIFSKDERYSDKVSFLGDIRKVKISSIRTNTGEYLI